MYLKKIPVRILAAGCGESDPERGLKYLAAPIKTVVGAQLIPKEKIEEIRERASIVSVISEYVPLTKRGHNHVGLCPFHSEKTPSFSVNEDKKIFHCFGCQETGNVITFLMKKEGMDFPEAAATLAKRYGIIIKEEGRGAPDSREPLFLALKTASEYFARTLAGSSGAPAREYLRKRGYEGEILERFRAGFAADGWDGLLNCLKGSKINLEAAEKAGLIVKKEKGYYDRFRNRIIFPITDARGRVIGFGGRALDNSEPKYLNSPESPVFKKGEVLYGFYQAKESMRSERFVIAVEGYFDLIALHKYGFTNSVATMGTALTPGHIRLLKNYTDSVYTLFDSDKAGINAAIRGLSLFLEEEMACRAVALSEYKDPDEFLKARGAEAMKAAVSKAEPLMEMYLRELKKRFDIKSAEGKGRYFEEALAYLRKVKNVAEKGHFAAIVAGNLGIKEDLVLDALKTNVQMNLRSLSGKFAEPKPTGRPNLTEMTLLNVVILHPDLFDDRVSAAFALFEDAELKEVATAVSLILGQGKKDMAALADELPSGPVKSRIAGVLMKQDNGFIESPRTMLEDSLKRILNKGKLKDATLEMLRQLEETGSPEIASEIKKRIESGQG